MCLSIKVNRPEDVLAEGEHLGFEWAVVHNTHGYRCGYVKVRPGHPWHGLCVYGAEDEGIRCHGGVTFAEADVPCGKEGLDNAWWLGFDCAHTGDAPDPALPGAGSEMRPFEAFFAGSFVDELLGLNDLGGDYGKVRSQDYVEEQCRSLCAQAKRAMVAASTAQDDQ
jgi:hypothetical protein